MSLQKRNESYELILLPGKCLPGGEYSKLYEEIYAKWKQIWVQVFTDVGSPQAWNADAFFRCDLIPVILCDGNVVAFYVATAYSLQPAWIQDHSYFSIYPKSTTDRLLGLGVKSVMSYEFLSVLPDRRKSTLGFSLGAVLVELGLSIRDELGCDAAVGVARLLNKVDQIAHGVGGFTLEKEARRGNLVCEIVGFLKENDRPYPDQKVHELAQYLWKTRQHVDRNGNGINKVKLALVA